MIAAGLIGLLRTDGALTALVGSDPMRVGPQRGEQGEKTPYVTYRVLSDTADYCKGNSAHTERAVVVFSCYDVSSLNAHAVATQLRRALHDKSGAHGGVHIRHLRYLSKEDQYADTAQLFGVNIEFEVKYNLL